MAQEPGQAAGEGSQELFHVVSSRSAVVDPADRRKMLRRGFNATVIAPAFQKNVDRFQKHTRADTFVKMFVNHLVLETPVPPHHPTPPAAHATPEVCPFVARGSQDDPRAAGSGQAPRLQTRCLRQRGIVMSRIWGANAFFYQCMMTYTNQSLGPASVIPHALPSAAGYETRKASLGFQYELTTF